MGGHNRKKRQVTRQAAYGREGKRMRLRHEKSTAAAHQFFHIPEMLLMELLPHCQLDSVMALAQTSHYARDFVKAFFATNQRILLQAFIGISNAVIAMFYWILEVSGSGMAGAFASSLLTPPYNIELTLNLNLFVPRGNVFLWRDFLGSLKLPLANDQPGVDRRYHHTTFSHVVFLGKSKGTTISISESRDNSVLTPLIGATTTLNTTICTAAKFYSLYADLLRQRRAIEGWFPTPVRKAVAIGKRGYRSSFSTTSWDRPCGLSCPVLWRHVRGLTGVGVFTWGGDRNQHDDFSEVGIPVTDNDFKWRLGDTCTNRHCQLRNANYLSVAAP
ncbi:hypothetical protein C8F04DRAFT_1185958 [Mycena alexandri]|uniref:F-box domain-containing protein n=1 Tax=Mycena alexandri TaxID=1745969 RepID=A0AAD6SP49_9AGAR|nr:hypothetical protein C8F04DRAFT_1185958 [Mycena alexandri]